MEASTFVRFTDALGGQPDLVLGPFTAITLSGDQIVAWDDVGETPIAQLTTVSRWRIIERSTLGLPHFTHVHISPLEDTASYGLPVAVGQ